MLGERVYMYVASGETAFSSLSTGDVINGWGGRGGGAGESSGRVGRALMLVET